MSRKIWQVVAIHYSCIHSFDNLLHVCALFPAEATSSYLHAYAFYSQAISMPANVRILLSGTGTNPHVSYGAKALITLYGIWNLDFDRSFFSDICLKIDTLAVWLLTTP